MKCFFFFVMFNGVALGIWLGGGFALRKKLFEHAPPDAPALRLSFWVLAVGGVLIFAAISLLYDFARAARRHASTIGAFRAYRFARRALSGSWMRALALWTFWLVLGGGAVLALLAITWEMPAVSVPRSGSRCCSSSASSGCGRPSAWRPGARTSRSSSRASAPPCRRSRASS